MKLSLLIVNYHTEKFIVELLSSLSTQTLDKSQFELIIVNNSPSLLLSSFMDKHKFDDVFLLKLINSDDNVGFGRAMNLAFEYAKGEHILLVNPDVKMTQDDYLEKLLIFANQNPDYGAISTQILDDVGNDVSTYYTYEFGQTLGFDGQICWFQGSLLLIRHQIFKALNGFDPDFFMYCEDVDLCLRIKKIGLDLLKNEQLSVYHFGGASEPNHDLNYYKRHISSQLMFAKKHYKKSVFDELILSLNKKAKNRLNIYKTSSVFIKKHRRHLLKNQAMYELTKDYL